jgi:hypothetical protein
MNVRVPHDGSAGQKVSFGHGFILSLNLPEQWKDITFLLRSIMLSPVAGFRPRLSRLDLTLNFPVTDGQQCHVRFQSLHFRAFSSRQ